MIKNRIIITMYLALTMVLLYYAFGTQANYSFNGYWSDKIFGWSWLFATASVIVYFWKNKAAKIYLTSLVILVILSILPLAFPFFAMLFFFTTVGDYERFQLNEDYRIHRTNSGAMSANRVYIYKKDGWLEKNIARPVINDIDEDFDKKDEYHKIDDAKLVDASQEKITIEYTINGKKIVVSHDIHDDYGW